MDRAKTLEVLRGMKFMQRKEEAKRREQFEIQQKERLEGRLPQDHDTQGDSGPTILYVHNVPTNSYALSRRSFKAPREGGADDANHAKGSSSADPSAVVIDGSAVHTRVPIDHEAEDSQDENENDEMDETDPSAPAYQNKKEAGKCESKRFYVEGGIRGPKMPKKLEEEMVRRKRQREEQDEDEQEETTPW